MKLLVRSLFPVLAAVLLALLIACSPSANQIVQVVDSGSGDSTADGMQLTDSMPGDNALSDATPDRKPPADASADASTDGHADVQADALTDALHDALTDGHTDGHTDESTDSISDSTPDNDGAQLDSALDLSLDQSDALDGTPSDADAIVPPAATLVLNEVRCTDGDFVEIYNTSPDTDVLLDGWIVADGDTSAHQYVLTGGLTLGPHEWMAIPKSSETSPDVGFPFGLSCGADTVRLLAPGEIPVDQISLPWMEAGETWGRIPDGSGEWQLNGPTPGGANGPLVDVGETLFSADRVVEIDLTLPDAGVVALDEEPYVYVPGTFHMLSGDFETGDVAVGLRLKGRYGSFQPLEEKASFKVSFNFADPLGRLMGLKRMTLNSMVSDPSMIHELVAYRLFQAFGLPGPRVGYAWVRLNGQDYGLYAIIEAFDDTWLSHTFATTGHYYEGGYGADFVLGDEDLFEVDEGDAANIQDLQGLIAAIDSSTPETFVQVVGPWLNLEAFARLAAMEHYVGHWDGYSVLVNNFYIHIDESGFGTMVPWGTDQVLNQYLPFYFGQGVLFRKCIASDACRALYDQALLGLVDVVAFVAPEVLAAETADFLRPWIEADQRKPWTNQEALSGLQENLDYIAGQWSRISELDQCINDPASLDLDGDGRVCDMDCEEGDPTTYVDAPEICTDVVDNDCNWLTDDGPTCPDCVDLYMGNHDYVVCLTIRNYVAAVQTCQQYGMTVVSLNSPTEEGWVLSVIDTYGLIESWIGLTRQPNGEFAWANGSALDWTNWEEGEPNGTPGYSDCVQIFTWKDWTDTSCKATNAVICEAQCTLTGDQDGDGFEACTEDCDDTRADVYPGAKDSSGQCADSVDQDCSGVADDGPACPPATWLDTPGVAVFEFAFLNQSQSRDEARLLCQELAPGGDLAWFDTPQELVEASAALGVVAPGVVVWIGLQDLVLEGQYLWADGSTPAFLNWASGQPNNYNGIENCCRLLPAGTFNDTGCGDHYRILCKAPK